MSGNGTRAFGLSAIVTNVLPARSFATPPKPVQAVCECVVVIRGIKDVSWKGAKGMMSDPSFLRTLQEMDVDAIPQSAVKTVKGFLKVRWRALLAGESTASSKEAMWWGAS